MVAASPLEPPFHTLTQGSAGVMSAVLSPYERRVAHALAEAAIPAGRFLEAGGVRAVDGLAAWLGGVPATARRVLRTALWAFETSTLPTHLRPFSSLSLDTRARVVEDWERSPSHARRSLLRALLTPIKHAHFDDPAMFGLVGCRYETAPVRDEQPRWLGQMTDGRQVDADLELECEVVVVGTGAGGAAAAYELASRGRAVLLLEEGDYHPRSTFNGRTTRAYEGMYRDRGATVALGNVGIPLWVGRAVGGSTVINSGTCYRAPERTLSSWRDEGLPSIFSSAGLSPYYERVEAMLQVTPADPRHLGAIGSIIARGAEHLGYSHHALARNAPDCDGQGVCCFGCPTGAKRSTDVSYLPAALSRGAQLITSAHVDRVDVVGGRARGVTATLGGGARRGPTPRLTVRAEAVVVAGGTLMTPLLLARSGACQVGGQLGQNLSIHPATKVVALFDDRVDQWNGIPQGYCIDEFAAEGIMFEGGSLPVDVAALGIPWTGRRFIELMEQYPHLATFGFMVKDTSRGSVRRGPGGSPLVLYDMNEHDRALMQRGIGILCEVYQRAGARRVLPLVAGHDEVAGPDGLARFRAAKLAAGDVEVTAFHPLGTCRLGVDPARSCIGPDHEAHDVASLYVCDGSAIPSSLGVNPQLTIMALALRAAEIIDSRL